MFIPEINVNKFLKTKIPLYFFPVKYNYSVKYHKKIYQIDRATAAANFGASAQADTLIRAIKAKKITASLAVTYLLSWVLSTSYPV